MWLVRTVRAVLFGSTKLALLIGLGALSWISTYTGMLELIKANMGEIGIEFQIAIGFAVAMLMLMIIWLLDQLFTSHNAIVKTLYTFGYVFLTLISVGFGFGFYWKFLESRSEASRSAESAVTQVQTAFVGASTRLEQLTATFDGLTVISRQKAADEHAKGNSCPNSRPGDGPRRRLRDDDARKFAYAGEFVSKRASVMKGDMTSLNGDLKKIASRDKSTIDPRTGTRNEFMKTLGRKLNQQVTQFNAFKTDPQLRQFRNDFSERSQRTIFPDSKGGTFSCPDAELQAALRGVVRAIDQLPALEKPKIAAVEGSEAIIEAFRRLTTTLLGAVTLKLPPSPEELRAQQEKAVQMAAKSKTEVRPTQEAGLGPRDYVPLSIALFVDICLLLVSIGRPVDGFARSRKKLDDAKSSDLANRLDTIRRVHEDPSKARIIEALDNVSFTLGGHYWVAVPLGQSEEAAIRLEKDILDRAEKEASVLKTVFVGLEDTGLYRQGMVPSTVARKKLARNGSVYQYWDTFRVYKFYKGKWPDFVVRVAMGGEKDIKRTPSPKIEPALMDVSGSTAKIDYNSSIENPHIGTPLEVQDKLRTDMRQEPPVDRAAHFVQQAANDASTEVAAARAAEHARQVAQQPAGVTAGAAGQQASQQAQHVQQYAQFAEAPRQFDPRNPIHNALDAVEESFASTGTGDARPAAPVIPIRRSRVFDRVPAVPTSDDRAAVHNTTAQLGGGSAQATVNAIDFDEEIEEAETVARAEPGTDLAKRPAKPITERLRRFRGAHSEQGDEQAIVYENDDTLSAVSARVSPEGDQIEVNVRMARRPSDSADQVTADETHVLDAPAERPALEQGAEPVVTPLMSLADRLEMNSENVYVPQSAPVDAVVVEAPVAQDVAAAQPQYQVEQSQHAQSAELASLDLEQSQPVQPEVMYDPQPVMQEPFVQQQPMPQQQDVQHVVAPVENAPVDRAEEADDMSDDVFDTASIANWFGQKKRQDG